MAKKKTLLKSKEQKSRTELVQFLRQLADKVEQKEFTIRVDNEETKVQLPDRVQFSLGVRKKPKRIGTKYTVKMGINWHDSDFLERKLTLD